MNWKDELMEEMGYTICPICFPEYVYCDEDCEHCKEYIDFKQFYERRKIEMCMYCEENEILKSANFCGSAKAKILGQYLDLYGDEKKFNIFKRIYRPSFKINYCPMCGRRLL